jgi:hypothetical protein
MATRRWRGAGDERAAGVAAPAIALGAWILLTPAMFSGTVLAAFALARTAGRTQLEAMVMRRAKLRKVDALLERRGFLAMLAARLMPGVAATGLHYALDRPRPHVGTSEDEARSSRATAASTARVVIDRQDG